MKLTWIQALKKWNESNDGSWCVPRKDSQAYHEIKALMTGEEKKTKKEKPNKENPKKEKPKREKLTEKFSAVDNANFKRGVEMTKKAIEADQKNNSASYKNADDAFRQLMGAKTSPVVVDEKEKANQERMRREALMADRDRQQREWIDRHRRETAARKAKPFIEFDINELNLPSLRKAILEFIENPDGVPEGAEIKFGNRTKLLRAQSKEVYDYMKRAKIQYRDVIGIYNEIEKNKGKRRK